MDLTSVEMFLGDGRVVHPHRVFPPSQGTAESLCAHETGSHPAAPVLAAYAAAWSRTFRM
ncbi:hypothetical protein LJR013_003385 [Pseudarthrobacter oxydans]|uniref:hypothetical protein n=1 Tax=Pseudarthrobacter oxydans TaxID=1671 RepID=UPI003ECEC26B